MSSNGEKDNPKENACILSIFIQFHFNHIRDVCSNHGYTSERADVVTSAYMAPNEPTEEEIQNTLD